MRKFFLLLVLAAMPVLALTAEAPAATPKRALEAALMAFTSAGGGYDGLSAQLIVALILSAQAAIEDTAAWAKGPLDPVAVVVLSPALRRTLSESAVRLRTHSLPSHAA